MIQLFLHMTPHHGEAHSFSEERWYCIHYERFGTYQKSLLSHPGCSWWRMLL